MTENFSELTDLLRRAGQGAREGMSFMDDYEAAKGADVRNNDWKPTGAAKLFQDRMIDGITLGAIGTCGHLAIDPTMPGYWVPFSPSILRCGFCHDECQASIRGTEEDRRCDLCGVVERAGWVHGAVVQSTAVVVWTAQVKTAIGPRTICYGLCHKCYLADDKAEDKR